MSISTSGSRRAARSSSSFGSGSASGTARPRSFADAARRTLERPLASYQLVLGSVAMLLGLGLIMVLSASSVFAFHTYGDSFAIVERQLVFAVLGVIGAVVASRLPLPVLRRLALPALVVVTLLIVLTFVPGVGLERNGNQNWLPLFAGFQLQPSELAKLACVLWIADLYARRQKSLHRPRYIVMPMVPVVGAIAALVVAQNDLGTALVIFALIAGMLYVAGLPRRQLLAVAAAIGVVCVFFVATAPHRVSRLLNVFDPMSDPDSAGYQAIHGMMAFARGGFWGVGLGGSRQKWGALPEAHTDFILAVVGEELGLLGSLVVLGLFVVLAVAGVRIASRTRDPFARYASIGIVIWLSTQAAINIGMVVGLLPVIGIPLPLLSYGGSSLMVTLVAAGVLLNCATTEPGARRALAASRVRRRRQSAARRR